MEKCWYIDMTGYNGSKHIPEQWFSNYGPWASIISIIWEFIRDVNSQALF